MSRLSGREMLADKAEDGSLPALRRFVFDRLDPRAYTPRQMEAVYAEFVRGIAKIRNDSTLTTELGRITATLSEAVAHCRPTLELFIRLEALRAELAYRTRCGDGR